MNKACFLKRELLVLQAMPIIKSSKKALRQSKKRIILNKDKILALKLKLKKLKKQKDAKALAEIYSLADRMVKTRVIHKNKAKRIKSQTAKLVSQPPPSSTVQSPKKNSPKNS